MKLDQLTPTATTLESPVPASQPTPFPDAADESKWPGSGPIRVFDWMPKDRVRFWARREQDQGSVVFVGDSLIGGWHIEQLEKCFPGLKLANRGMGGDVTRVMLHRLREDVLDLKPSAVVMCIGTNDLSTLAEPSLIAGNIAMILDELREANAGLPIVVCQIPPRDVKDIPVEPSAIADLNRRIAELVEGREKVVVIDLFNLLATADGKLTPEYFSKDGIHIASAGHAKWAMALREAFADLGVK